MRHPLQQAALERLRASEDCFPHDRDYLESFIVNTDGELWEILEKISEGDEEKATIEAGHLSWIILCLGIGDGGELPVWYRMKPSQYQKAKAAAVKKLREAERELTRLMPELDHVSLLHTLWPDGHIPVDDFEAMDDVAMKYYGGRANVSVSRLLNLYESLPEHCPTLTGQRGAIETVCREAEQFEPVRYGKPKSGPVWPRHFVCALSKQIGKDRVFRELSKADQYRLIDYCLHFYGRWIDRENDTADWTPERVADAV